MSYNFPNPFFIKTNIDKYIFYSGPKYTGSLPHSHGEALNLMVSGQKNGFYLIETILWVINYNVIITIIMVKINYG